MKDSVLIPILVMVAAFGLLPSDLYAPALPTIPALLHTTQTMTQYTISVYLLGYAISQIVSGALTDNLGRKPIMIAGLLIFILGSIFCAFANSINMLIMARLIQGIGAAAVGVLTRIILRDVFNGKRLAQVASYIGASVTLSPAIAPVIGGYLQTFFGFHSVFVFLLLYAIIVLLAGLFFYKETNKKIESFSIKKLLENYKLILTNKLFLSSALFSGSALSIVIVSSVINPYLFQINLHISPAHYGMWAFLALLGIFTGMLINSRLVLKLGFNRMLLLGVIVIFIGFVFIVFVNANNEINITTTVLASFIVCMGVAFILPNAIMRAFEPFSSGLGTIGAVYGSIQILTTSIASAIVSNISYYSLTTLGTFVGSLGCICLICWLIHQCYPLEQLA